MDTTVPNSDHNYMGNPSRSRRGAARSRSRRNGRLQPMLELPLDLIMEICNYLHPRDLLHLARSTKELRAFFMSRNSLQFWAAARATVTDPLLPPCPSDLSEPEYANLMFDARCHNCLKQNCHDVYLACRVRLCKACYGELSIPIYDCRTSGVIDEDVFQLIHPLYIEDLIPTLSLGASAGNCFYIPQLDYLLNELLSIPQDSLVHYLNSRQDLVLSLVGSESTEELWNFLQDSRATRSAELYSLREKRKQDIIARLREAGYGRELDRMMDEEDWLLDMERFEKLPEVRKPQALTARIWTNIQEAVIQYMEDVRDFYRKKDMERILVERLSIVNDVVEQFASSLRSQTFLLGLTMVIPEIYGLFSPAKASVGAEELQRSLWELMPQFLETWEREMKEMFVKQTRERLGIDDSVDPFELALAGWFTCLNCNVTLRLPYAMYHQCSSRAPPPNVPEWFSPDDYEIMCAAFELVATSVYHFIPMNLLNASGTHQTEVVIRLCGLDPRTATPDDLDEENVWLQCLSHDPEGPGIPIMNWRTAATHRCNSPHPVLAPADDQQICPAGEGWEEAERRASIWWEMDRVFSCAYCEDVEEEDASVVKDHLLSRLGVEEMTDDTYVDTHRGVLAPLPVWLVSRTTLGQRWLDKFGHVAQVTQLVDF